jgi:hypothetical protein
MKRSAIVIAPLLVCFPVLALAQVSVVPTYEDAVSEVVRFQGDEWASEFKRCRDGWRTKQRERIELFKLFELMSLAEEEVVLLVEIGNSGFSRYDYLLVSDGYLRSSFGPGKRISSAMSRAVSGMGVEGAALWGNPLPSEAYDDDCYFVTLRRNDSKQVMASYGVPETDVGSIIENLVLEARSE